MEGLSRTLTTTFWSWKQASRISQIHISPTKAPGYGVRSASSSSEYKRGVRVYNQPPDWKVIRDKVFPKLPKPAIKRSHSYMPRKEKEEEIIKALPSVEYEVPVTANIPTQLPMFVPLRPRVIEQPPLNMHGESTGVGKRKTCVAHAWTKPGTGQWNINGRPSLMQYFPQQSNRDVLLHPFVATESIGKWDTKLIVRGGGFKAQAEASRMAVAHALANHDAGLRAPLKVAGYYKRDLRQVERKKPGQKKARKKFQWVRR